MLETAYVNAWTDLTVSGTSGDDDFVLRLNNSGFQPSVEVELNGEVQFTHWISTLDSLTLNGGSRQRHVHDSRLEFVGRSQYQRQLRRRRRERPAGRAQHRTRSTA